MIADLEDDLVANDQAAANSKPSTSTSTCTCQCCTKPETPYHPSEVSDSKVAVAHHSKERKMGQLKTYSRKIQPSWYGKYHWILVCTSRYKIFCSTCRGAKQLGLLSFSKHQKTVFTEEGYGIINRLVCKKDAWCTPIEKHLPTTLHVIYELMYGL